MQIVRLLALLVLGLWFATGLPSLLGAQERVAQETAAQETRWNVDIQFDRHQAVGLRIGGLPPAVLTALTESRWSQDKWQDAIRVVVAQTDTDSDELPSVLGRFQVVDRHIVFRPQFALQPGLSYRVVIFPRRLPAARQDWPLRWETVVKVPGAAASDMPPTRVTAVYPTQSVLPENLLKFYIHFSAPMRRGDAYRHVQLRDDQDQVVAYAFLELPEELWDPTLQRFTLLLDPGRIKRGLKPREELGPILKEGHVYTLVIARDWLDAQGHPLAETFKKTFRVGPPDEVKPDLNRWQVSLPRAGGREPVLVRFDEPLDHGLLQRMIWLSDERGRVVPGSAEVVDGETAWRFVPDTPWQPGEYRLCADARLEDLAGNSIARPFEVDLFESVQKSVPQEIRQRPLRISP